MSANKHVAFSDLELPRAAVLRILKKANTNKLMIGKDPKLAVAKSGTLFISFLTAAAQEMAAKSGQKTINLGHVQGALDAIGFGDWCDPLKRRLDQYTAAKASKKSQGAQDEEDEEVDIDEKTMEDGAENGSFSIDPNLAADPESDDAADEILDDEEEGESDEEGELVKRPRLDDLLGQAGIDDGDDDDML